MGHHAAGSGLRSPDQHAYETSTAEYKYYISQPIALNIIGAAKTATMPSITIFEKVSLLIRIVGLCILCESQAPIQS
jgi:hypothetical protein